eukprot:5382099-Amphidinium_carterae.1
MFHPVLEEVFVTVRGVLRAVLGNVSLHQEMQLGFREDPVQVSACNKDEPASTQGTLSDSFAFVTEGDAQFPRNAVTCPFGRVVTWGVLSFAELTNTHTHTKIDKFAQDIATSEYARALLSYVALVNNHTLVWQEINGKGPPPIECQ